MATLSPLAMLVSGGALAFAPLVTNEWDRLAQVVVGRGEDSEVPTWSEAYTAYLSPIERVFFRRNQHKRLSDVAPELEARLVGQLDGLVRLLADLGVAVRRNRPLTEEEGDFAEGNQNGGGLMFVRDPMVVIGDTVLELSLKRQFRRKERFALRPAVSEAFRHGEAHWVAVPPASPSLSHNGDEDNPFLEGGDILQAGPDILVGLSDLASNEAGARWLQRFLGPAFRVHPVRLRPDVLHLDLALTLVRPGLAVACPTFLPDGPPDFLRGWDIVLVGEAEGKDMGANVLAVDPVTVLLDARQNRLAVDLEERGIRAIPVPFDAPAAFGGGIRCATQPLRRVAA
ncbi:MAG: arginine deiminase family protein [Magnetospirillum sp. WYHS-4]